MHQNLLRLQKSPHLKNIIGENKGYYLLKEKGEEKAGFLLALEFL